MRLLEPLDLGPRTARNRVLFGPHVTNLGDDDRQLTARHTAYYGRRAQGGCGTIVVEGASVHPSDWPYERAPLAERCGEGWAAVAAVCHDEGALVLASLDHAGGQGSSAYSQLPLWAPSRVPEVNTREVPKWMEADDIAAVVEGFAGAAKLAVDAGCDGVEVNAAQHSLLRQFLSGLTNQRDDEWGAERTKLAHDVLAAVRAAVGPTRLVVLRLSCDELAPWAGITPEQAPALAAELVTIEGGPGVDALVVTRGSIFSVEQTRPDFHQQPGLNIDLALLVGSGVDVPVVVQGSMVDVEQAGWAVEQGCAGVEMTRAQIADPDLVVKLRAGQAARIRPCTRCNQTCQVRDVRNPLVTCIGEPSSGRETEDPDWTRPARRTRHVAVVGGGPAGLEAARIAALRGHRVTVIERDRRLGGVATVAGPNRPIVDWLAGEVERLGVDVRVGTTEIPAGADVVVQCTGSQPGRPDHRVEDGATLFDVLALRRGEAQLPADGDVVILDPIGGPIGVALAEELGRQAVLVTQDQIAGNELARSGDLAPANTRLARAGVRIERRTIPRVVRAGEVEVEDRFSGERRTIACVAVVDCGYRLPDAPLPDATVQAGDCVAPRTVYEAILEGRRVGLSL
ncbi:MAG: mycofactocin system FadH/OYE family oxidoreductase 1 [Ilumatobacteraceae bacterium]